MEKYVLVYEEWSIEDYNVEKVYFNDIKTLNEKAQEIIADQRSSIVFSGLIKEEYKHDISS